MTPRQPPVLWLEFNDGLAGELDCGFLRRGTLGEPLGDPEYFRQVRVDDELRTIVWPNGLDPAPELLHDEVRSAGAVAQHDAA